MQPLLDAVRTKNKDQAYEFKKNDTWTLLESLVGNEVGMSDGAGTSRKNGAPGRGTSVSSENLSNSGDNDGGAGGSGGAGATWTCDHCTFINGSVLSSCEMCGLPR